MAERKTAVERKTRCRWAESDELMRAYHDKEWGKPVRDSRALWEMLCLEGFQAGLSWAIILKKREAPLSAEISKTLKKLGFKFCGPVIVHAWMQAVGLVDDHDPTCFRRR